MAAERSPSAFERTKKPHRQRAAVRLHRLDAHGAFYWMLVTSLKDHEEIYGTKATLWPNEPTLDSYRIAVLRHRLHAVLQEQHVRWRSRTTFFTVMFASLGAYAITRLRFPGRRLFARVR